MLTDWQEAEGPVLETVKEAWEIWKVKQQEPEHGPGHTNNLVQSLLCSADDFQLSQTFALLAQGLKSREKVSDWPDESHTSVLLHMEAEWNLAV